jgi:hypothetical protein
MNLRLTVVWLGVSQPVNYERPLELHAIHSYDELCSKIKEYYSLSGNEFHDGVITDEKRDLCVYSNEDLAEAARASPVLYFFDKHNSVKKELLRSYDQTKNTKPHYNVITEGASYPQSAKVMRGTELVYSVTWPLSEFIDNSMSAIRSKRELIPAFHEGKIEIRIIENDKGIMSVIIRDNGKGLTDKRLEEWATMSLKPGKKRNCCLSSSASCSFRGCLG